jgi:uncharacterized protein
MRASLTIQFTLAALLTTPASIALDAPKPAVSQDPASSSTPEVGNSPRVLQWEDLLPPQERDSPYVGSRARPLFDDETGPAAVQEGSAAVNASLDGNQVKLPGFIVPLSVDKSQMVSEFLLVPYFGACIHVPPPPPNQIVYVAMSKPIRLEMAYDPVWVTGRLAAQAASTGLATASYSLAASKIEKYEEPP